MVAWQTSKCVIWEQFHILNKNSGNRTPGFVLLFHVIDIDNCELQGTDKDSGLNGELRYSLSGTGADV